MKYKEIIQFFPYEITRKKRVQAGVNGYGRTVTYIQRLDVLCHKCKRCGVTDYLTIEGSECRHKWEKHSENIAMQIVDEEKKLLEYEEEAWN